MKKMIALAVLSLALVGCGLDKSDIDFRNSSCTNKGGEPYYVKWDNGEIAGVRCVVDGISYRVGQNTGTLLDGRVVE